MIKLITTIAAMLILTFSWAGTATADEFGSGLNTFEIEFVTIGNPGNFADTTYADSFVPPLIPAGSVPYTFEMGKFEISRDMIEKANVQGGLGITLEDMEALGIVGGNGPNRPATGVSWNEAARFVNWLNTSKGHAAAYKFEFQPGDAGYDSNANIQLWDPGDAGYDPYNLFRNSQAKYVLPSFDEWYKAAYYDPTANGGLGGYWDYPTGSNTPPTSVFSGTMAGTAVYKEYVGQEGPAGPADVSSAGGLSPYGTMGQGGNVYEWEESEIDLVNDSNSSARALRGGRWDSFGQWLRSENRSGTFPSAEGFTRGFRVVSCPEPTSQIPGGDVFGTGSNLFDIDFVPITNKDNPADTTGIPNPAGSVGYSFRMGKFEISEETIDKANAEGGLGITKDTRGPNKPATSVSWNEAARFVNWLNTSAGYPAAYKFEFQPGEAGYDANANIQLWDPGDVGYNPNNRFRNSQAEYWLPSYDEWYKAAYYDPTSGSYFDFPTGSDTVPTPVASSTTAGTAVFNQLNATGPADIIQAGGPSPYGPIGQGGNVWEWEESEFDLVNDINSAARGIRGGVWDDIALSLHSDSRFSITNPTDEGLNIGFRVASDLVVRGDANDDGVFDNLDIFAFGLALGLGEGNYAAMYPGVDPNRQLDMNYDGTLNSLDISPFAQALFGP